jgi:origin recognition complex subunit 3
MHHYYGDPLSIFSPMDGSTLTKEKLITMHDDGVLTEDHATHIRMLQSFRTHIDRICETEPNEALQLLDNDRYLMTTALPKLLNELDEFHQAFHGTFEMLTAVQGCFPTFAGLRRSKRMLYLEWLENKHGLAESEIVRWLVSLVRKMSLEGLTGLLKTLSELLTELEEGWSDSVRGKLNYKEKILSWMERLGMEEVEHNEDEEDHIEEDEKVVVNEQLPDLDEGRQTKTAKRVKMYIITKKGGEPVKVSTEIADWLQEIFRYASVAC